MNKSNKKELLYCIVEVWDYAGGELGTDMNLSYEEFIGHLTEKVVVEFDDDYQYQEITLPDLTVAITDIINEPNFQPLYAGQDTGFVGELYVIEEGRVEQVDFTDFVEDMAIQILEWEKEL